MKISIEEYEEERKLLHKQLNLLAEQSNGCPPHELAELSEQMANLYRALNDKHLQRNNY